MTQTTHSTLEIAEAMGRIFNDGDDEAARQFVAPDFVDHEARPGTPNGPEGYAGTAAWMRSIFTDAHWEIVDSFASADKACLRVVFTGKHTAEFLGIPPTGREVTVNHAHLYRIAGGQVVEHWGFREELQVLRQLGVTEIPPAPGGDQQ